jgi:hypothetical protein
MDPMTARNTMIAAFALAALQDVDVFKQSSRQQKIDNTPKVNDRETWKQRERRLRLLADKAARK